MRNLLLSSTCPDRSVMTLVLWNDLWHRTSCATPRGRKMQFWWQISVTAAMMALYISTFSSSEALNSRDRMRGFLLVPSSCQIIPWVVTFKLIKLTLLINQETKWTVQWGLETVLSEFRRCTSPAQALCHAAKASKGKLFTKPTPQFIFSLTANK